MSTIAPLEHKPLDVQCLKCIFFQALLSEKNDRNCFVSYVTVLFLRCESFLLLIQNGCDHGCQLRLTLRLFSVNLIRLVKAQGILHEGRLFPKFDNTYLYKKSLARPMSIAIHVSSQAFCNPQFLRASSAIQRQPLSTAEKHEYACTPLKNNRQTAESAASKHCAKKRSATFQTTRSSKVSTRPRAINPVQRHTRNFGRATLNLSVLAQSRGLVCVSPQKSTKAFNVDLLSTACTCSSLAKKHILSKSPSMPTVPIPLPSDLRALLQCCWTLLSIYRAYHCIIPL